MLPRIRSLEEYQKIYADAEFLRPAAQAIAERHDLKEPLCREPLGTHVVFRCGESVTIKIFCPLWPEDFFAEHAALTHIQVLPVPSVLHNGEIDGWPYLVMKRLPGIPAVTVWSGLPENVKLDLVRQLGQWMRDLHRSPVPGGMTGKWDAFIRERLERAEAHHAMPEPWSVWIQEQLRDFTEPPMAHVLLHADITADHLLLTADRAFDCSDESCRDDGVSGNWRAAGLIDFGDAKAGHPLYEFIAPLAFYCFGRPDLSLELIRAYGMEPSPELLAMLTRYCLLHEFGTIRSFQQQFPADTPEQFVAGLWGQARRAHRAR